MYLFIRHVKIITKIKKITNRSSHVKSERYSISEHRTFGFEFRSKHIQGKFTVYCAFVCSQRPWNSSVN
jgi:hypothetical protein